MTGLYIVGAVVLVTVVVAGMLLSRLVKAEHAAAVADARAEKAEADAKLQGKYAEIATRGRSVDDTAGVLDKGLFLVPPAQGIHPRGTEEGRSRNQGDA